MSDSRQADVAAVGNVVLLAYLEEVSSDVQVLEAVEEIFSIQPLISTDMMQSDFEEGDH
jgi:hypothetical protein